MPKLISNVRKLAYNTLRGKAKGTDAYELACFAILATLSVDEQQSLVLLVNKGPVSGDDVKNNSFLRSLVENGLAADVCVNGDPGYMAATTIGFDVIDYNVMFNGKYADPVIAKD